MIDNELKDSALQELIDLMDEREGMELKKHPKLMAASVEVEKPEMKVEGESPEVEESAEGEISAEDLQKLIEHFKGL